MENIKDRIKKLRRELDLTQTEFAKKIGTKQSTITGYENGLRTPSGLAVSSICKAFGVNEKWLLDGTGDMFAKSEEISLDDFARQHGATDFEIKIIKAYFSLSDDLRHEFLAQLRANFEQESSVEDAEGEYIKKISGSAQSTGSTASNSTDATA